MFDSRAIYVFFIFLFIDLLSGIKKNLKQVSRRGAISGASPNKQNDNDDQEIAALAAITGAIMEQMKKSKTTNKQSIIQIVIYESSVWNVHFGMHLRTTVSLHIYVNQWNAKTILLIIFKIVYDFVEPQAANTLFLN